MGTLDAKAIDLYELYGLPAGYTFTANCRIQDVNLQSAQPSAVLRQEGHLVEASVPESIAAALSGTLTIESYVRVCGNVVEDLRTNTRSTVDSAAVLLNSLDVISAAVPDLPGRLLCHTSSAETSKAQLNGTHMNLRLDHRILDLRNASNSAVAKILSATHQLATQHVAEEGYHWVSTPTLIDYQLPGDNDYFEVPYMHGITARLAQSSEMHLGMALAADMERVYDIHTSFRREPNTSTRHLTEAGSFKLGLDKNERIPRITFQQAKKILTDKLGVSTDPSGDFTSGEEKLLGEYFATLPPDFGSASDIFLITHYPRSMRPYNYHPSDDVPENYTNSFDVIIRGQECASSAQFIHSYDDVRAAMVARDPPMDPNAPEWASFFGAHEAAMPPGGGYGVGLNRFVQGFLGLDDVHDAVVFPRDASRLRP